MDRKHSEDWQSRVSRTVNSAACFSLAYVMLTYLLWVITGLACRLFKFDAFVYYYGIKVILNSHGWDKAKIAVVYSSGPVVILLIALLCFFLYKRMRDIKSLLNVFFLWVFIIGVGIFVSHVIIGALGIYRYGSYYYQGLAVTFSWLRVPKFVAYMLNGLIALFVIYMGANIARPFLIFSFSYSKINNLTRRRKYFFETALAPFILGALITIIAVFPKERSAMGVLILLATTHAIYLVVTGIILGIGWLSLPYVEMAKPELVRYKSLQVPNIFFIIFMLVSWVYIYITLRGVYFGG